MIRLPSWFEFLLGIIALCKVWQDATNLPGPQTGSYGTDGVRRFSIHGMDQFVVIDDATKVLALALRDDCEVEV